MWRLFSRREWQWFIQVTFFAFRSHPACTATKQDRTGRAWWDSVQLRVRPSSTAAVQRLDRSGIQSIWYSTHNATQCLGRRGGETASTAVELKRKLRSRLDCRSPSNDITNWNVTSPVLQDGRNWKVCHSTKVKVREVQTEEGTSQFEDCVTSKESAFLQGVTIVKDIKFVKLLVACVNKVSHYQEAHKVVLVSQMLELSWASRIQQWYNCDVHTFQLQPSCSTSDVTFQFVMSFEGLPQSSLLLSLHFSSTVSHLSNLVTSSPYILLKYNKCEVDSAADTSVLP